VPSAETVEIAPASISQKSTIRAFLEQYLAEFGYRQPYPYFDEYWSDPLRHPFLICRQGAIAGFAFVRFVSDAHAHEMAEFYVLPQYRGCGVGRSAVTALLSRFPGPWNIPVQPSNRHGLAFWSRVLEGVPKIGSGDSVVFSYGGAQHDAV
jgi:predicted acetyltransferase